MKLLLLKMTKSNELCIYQVGYSCTVGNLALLWSNRVQPNYKGLAQVFKVNQWVLGSTPTPVFSKYLECCFGIGICGRKNKFNLTVFPLVAQSFGKVYLANNVFISQVVLHLFALFSPHFPPHVAFYNCVQY